eukprot:scaffold78651_cov20-Tisochrysis_lutea.AAC.2
MFVLVAFKLGQRPGNRQAAHVWKETRQLAPSAAAWVWDLQTLQLKASSKGIEAYINCVAANPLGTTCVSASWDDSLRLHGMTGRYSVLA